MKKKKIAILRGGQKKYEKSLKSGFTILRALSKYIDEIDTIDIFIDKDGNWFEKGIPSDAHRSLSKVDYYLDLTFDHFGNHHALAKKIDLKHISKNQYISISSRSNLKRIIEQMSLDKNIFSLAKYKVLRNIKSLDTDLKEIWRTFHMPIVIKNDNIFDDEKSILTFDFNEAKNKIKSILEKGDSALIEEHEDGTFLSISLLPNYREEEYYVSIPIEILNKDAKHRKIINKDLEEKIIKEKYLISHEHDKKIFIHNNSKLKKDLKDLIIEIHKTLLLDSHLLLDICLLSQRENDKYKIKILEIHLEPHIFEGTRFFESLSASGVDIGKYIIDKIEKIEQENIREFSIK